MQKILHRFLNGDPLRDRRNFFLSEPVKDVTQTGCLWGKVETLGGFLH